MKYITKISAIFFLITGLTVVLQSCKKKYPPDVTTSEVSQITQTSAVSGGNVTNNGGTDVTARGIYWGTSQNPESGPNKTINGAGNGTFASNITGLTPNTLYYIKAYATNSEGTSFGSQVNFTTSPDLPVAAFTASSTTITEGQSVQFTDQSTNNTTSWSWNFGDGSTSTSKNPAHVYSSAGTFTVTLTVTNIAGSDTETKTNYISVSTNTISDKDGNSYKIVTIGTQVWMQENLKTTKYSDGSPITMVTDGTQWANLTSEAYCWYNNDAATSKNLYGALYNWFAVNTGKLCPTGWHVPTDSEWIQLEMFLGMSYDVAQQIYWRGTNEGTKLKSTTGWYMDGNGTNDFGFTALPAGMRYDNGEFRYIGNWTDFWSSTGINTAKAWSRALGYSNTNIGRYDDTKTFGFCIRCIKD